MSTYENATAAGSSKVRSHVRAADLILAEADKHDVRPPVVVKTDRHTLDFLFDQVDVLTEWAIWAEAPIATSIDEQGTHYVAKGILFDQPVTLGAVAPHRCRCGHPKSAHVVFGAGCNASTGHGGTCNCMGFRLSVPAALVSPSICGCDPCQTCQTRRDEHAGQPDVKIPALAITDHDFVAPPVGYPHQTDYPCDPYPSAVSA